MAAKPLPRFVITKIDEPPADSEPTGDSVDHSDPPPPPSSSPPASPPVSSPLQSPTRDDAMTFSPTTTPLVAASNQPIVESKVPPGLVTSNEENTDAEDKQMALFEEEEEELPLVSRVIYRLANYNGGIVPDPEEMDRQDDTVQTPETADSTEKRLFKIKKKKAAKKPQKLGTVLGVYFPCIQNIFGVILFIRLVWVVGTAGWVEAFIIAFLCCCCTMTTAISMSAIATNGVVPGGGSYFMISRSLGPEFGGAVGILFYLGTTVASSMYIVGAVEILLQYIVPKEASMFGDIDIPSNAYNCYRVYGTCLLLLMFLCVFIGVKFVSKFSPVALFCVIFSILCVYIGIFVSNPNRGPRICFLGDRLLALKKIQDDNGTVHCDSNSEFAYQAFCGNTTDANSTTDPNCAYFLQHEMSLRPGIPGLASGKFMENAFQNYNKEGNRIGADERGEKDKGDIIVDISTSFIVLIGIFFPSVTGIMAGSNRSGDLADAQKSIPVGTIGAVATTSVVYLSCLLFFAACVEGQFLRDKVGESMGSGLIVAQMAWPSPWVILIGAFLSTCGAGLQSLVGAPRLLQAIAADGVVPFLNFFAVTNDKGEPRRALFLTAAIAEGGVLLANVDYIAPIITMFFLMCYCFTNLACALQTILKTPNWRPRFRLYHWTLSVFGVCLCLALMFMASWYYAIIAIVFAAAIYKYIEFKGAEKEWGDGIRGLAMTAASFALLRLEEGQPHVKNWRPQLLILLKLTDTLEPKYPKLLTFSSQLKAGKGLTLVAAIIEGKHSEKKMDSETAKLKIVEAMKKEKVKGFSEVIITKNIGDGISYLIQGSGLGGLRHNSLLMNWPNLWRQENKGYQAFIETMRIASDRQLAVMIVKGINQFPENEDRMGGTIDIWWIVHEGGLLMLLPFLLTQSKVWKKCKLRIFTVAQIEDNSIQIQKDMEKFVYQLRIPAQVKVVEMPSSDISEYTYERTLQMEQRNALLEKMKIKRTSLTPQMIMDQAHQPRRTSTDVSIDIEKAKEGKEKQNDKTAKAEEGGEKSKPKSPTLLSSTLLSPSGGGDAQKSPQPQPQNVRRMHTAIRLNQVIKEESAKAKLVILNLPGPPKDRTGEENYMDFLDALTEGLERVIMVRGGGKEVITIYS